MPPYDLLGMPFGDVDRHHRLEDATVLLESEVKEFVHNHKILKAPGLNNQVLCQRHRTVT
jgi:hypothetical protein